MYPWPPIHRLWTAAFAFPGQSQTAVNKTLNPLSSLRKVKQSLMGVSVGGAVLRSRCWGTLGEEQAHSGQPRPKPRPHLSQQKRLVPLLLRHTDLGKDLALYILELCVLGEVTQHLCIHDPLPVRWEAKALLSGMLRG